MIKLVNYTVKRTLVLACLVLLGWQTACAQTSLTYGDAVITGWNNNAGAANRQVQVLLLKSVTAGSVFKITAAGFNNSGTANSAANGRVTGGVSKWTNTTGGVLPAGTVINISNGTVLTSDIGTMASVTAGCACGASGSAFLQSTSSGRLFLYYGGTSDGTGSDFSNSSTTATFNGTPLSIVGFHGNQAWTSWLTTGSTGNFMTYLPSDLASYSLFLASGAIGGYYTGARSGASAAAIRAAVLNPANWTTVSGVSATATIPTGNFTVGASLSFTGSNSLSICRNSSANAINANLSIVDGSASGTTETWTVVIAPTHGTLSGFSTTRSLSGGVATPVGCTYTPTSGYTGTDAFVIRASNGAGSTTQSVNVTVTGAPAVPTISGASAVCTGSTIALTSTTTGGTWGTTASILSINSTGVVTGISPGSDLISYAVTNACGITVNYKNITVNAGSSVAAISGAAPSTFCPGTSFTATNATAGGTWSSSAPAIATVSATGVVTAVSGGAAYISYSVTGSCGTSAATPLYVRTTPTPIMGPIYGASSVCIGSNITLTDSIGAGYWTSSAPAIATISVSGVVTGLTAGTTTISFENSNACGTRRATKVITVAAGASVASIGGGSPSTFCPGTTFTATDATAGGTWSSSVPGVATVSAGGVVTAVSGGVTYISYSVTGSCGTTSATPVYVRVTPTPFVGPIYGASSVCTGSTIALTDSIGAGYWATLNPTFATVDGTGIVTGITVGTATITFENSNACGTRRTSKIVTVNTIPSVAAISGSSSVAVGASATLSNATTGGTWASSATAIATVNGAGLVTGLAAGVATISYAVATSCGTVYATLLFTVGSVTGSTYNISTIAGTGVAGYNGEGAVASVNLNYPYAAVKDAAGNMYIADQVNHRVRKITAAGVVSTIAGNGGAGFSGDGGAATAAALNIPTGVLVDASGNVYITDCYNGRIRKVSTTGIITTVVGGGTGVDGSAATAANLYRPTSICFDASGNMYIAETGNHKVRKINTSGIISTFAGTGVSGFNGDGAGAATKQLSSPICVIADGSGNVYISDLGNNLVRKVTTAGAISTIAGTGTAGYSGDGGAATAARIHSPYGIAMDASGNIYICDFDNYGIRKVSAAGIITTFAGNASYGYSGDGGWATAANLSRPTGVSVDAAGNVYVADQYNHRIRKITLGCLLPSAGTISGPATVIVGNSSTLANTVSGGTWSSVSLPVATVSAAGVVRGVAAGIDTIKYTVTNSCGTSRAVYVVSVTSSRPGEEIFTAQPAQLNVYPNPSTGLLTIETQQDKVISDVVVFDLTGKVVHQANGNTYTMQVDMSAFAPGVYIFKVAYANGQVGQVRVIKE